MKKKFSFTCIDWTVEPTKIYIQGECICFHTKWKNKKLEVCIALSSSLYSVCHNYNGISNWYELKHTADFFFSLVHVSLFSRATISMLSFCPTNLALQANVFFTAKTHKSQVLCAIRKSFCSLPSFSPIFLKLFCYRFEVSLEIISCSTFWKWPIFRRFFGYRSSHCQPKIRYICVSF